MKTKLIFLALIIFCSTYTSAQIGLSIHDSTFVLGDTLNIPIYADNLLTGQDIVSYRLQFTYDSNILRILSVVTNSTLSQGLSVSYNNQILNKINIAAAGTIPLAGEGILIFIKAIAINSGGTSFSFTDTLNNYFNESSPGISFRNGYLSIPPRSTLSINPSSGLLTVGETMQFSTYSGQSPISWSVTDASAATINSNGLLTALKAGFIKVIAKDAAGIIDSTSGTVEIRSFKLSIRDTAGYQGQIVEIPVYVSDLTGLNVYSGQFNLSFNGYVLTPINIIKTGTLIQNYSDPVFNYNGNGQMSVAFAGTSALSGRGILMYLRFQIEPINTGSTGLSFSNIIFNQNLTGNSTGGSFNIINLSSLAISPSTASLVAGDTLRFIASNGTPPYKWTVSDTNLAKIDQTGLLYVIKAGTIIITAIDNYGAIGNSGNIILFDAKIIVLDISATNGTSAELPVVLGNLSPSFSISSFQTNILFDSALVKFDQIVSLGTSTSGWSFSVNNQGNKIILSAASANGFNNPGIIFKIKFKIANNANNGNSTGVYLQQFLFNEGSPKPMVKDGSITTGNVNVFTIQATTDLNGIIAPNGSVPVDSGANQTFYFIPFQDYHVGILVVDNQPVDDPQNSYTFTAVTANHTINITFYTPLSVVFLSFASYVQGRNILLNWSTQTEKNSNKFNIERKTISADWQTIGSVKASVLSNSPKQYSFTDKNLQPGKYQYRLKLIYNDGTFEYSKVIETEVTVPKNYVLSQNFPNAFNPFTIISYSLPLASNVKLIVYNSLGQTIKVLENGFKNAGTYSVTFDASELSSGIYLYRIEAGQFSQVKKMILLK